MTLVDWQLYALLAVLAAALLAAIGALVALRRTSRELSSARVRLASMVDPCADPIEVRLKCLEHQLAELDLPSRRNR